LLTAAELAAGDALAAASVDELREAMGRMPSYQRAAVRWLARELELGRAGAPQGLSERERALQLALLDRSRLEREIASSAATAEQKAFMQQHISHLWRQLLEASRGPVISR